MWKAMGAISAAAMLALAVSLMPGFNPEAGATAPDPAAKADRADTAGRCEQRGWPYYEAACLRDDTRNAGRVLKVRMVSTDRVAQANPQTDFDLAPRWPLMASELQVAVPRWALGRQ